MSQSNERKRRNRLSDLGSLFSDEVLPIEVFSRRLGIGAWALRKMRQAGLRVLRAGGRGFIYGADFLAFLERQNEKPEP